MQNVLEAARSFLSHQSCLAHQLHYEHQCSAYLTFQQAKSLGGLVRQGERGVLLVLYQEIERPSNSDDDEDETRRLFLAKGFTVCDLEQTTGLDHVRERLDGQRSRGFKPLEECERILQRTGAVIREGARATTSRCHHDATAVGVLVGVGLGVECRTQML